MVVFCVKNRYKILNFILLKEEQSKMRIQIKSEKNISLKIGKKK